MQLFHLSQVAMYHCPLGTGRMEGSRTDPALPGNTLLTVKPQGLGLGLLHRTSYDGQGEHLLCIKRGREGFPKLLLSPLMVWAVMGDTSSLSIPDLPTWQPST